MSEPERTKEDERAISSLRRLAKRWPRGLWLFSASGSLHVMKANSDGSHIYRGDGIDPEYSLATINIPNDGGDW